MFVKPAFAQEVSDAAAAAPVGGDLLTSLFPLVLVLFIFYFLLLRPQQKRVRQHIEMVNKLSRGDKIVTGGGLIGTVVKILGDDEIMIELAENVRVKAVRSTITTVIKPEGNQAPSDKEAA